MFIKTHIILVIFFILFFFQYIDSPLIFFIVSIFATIIPDIDNKFSKIGHYKILRIFNFFMKHRGMIHSFTIMFFLSFLIFLFFKNILIPFIFGYSLHLILDSLTIKGITPFYPFKMQIKGKIKTGGIIESIIFILFILADLFFISIYFLRYI